jgi:hypothetical protein
LGVNFDALDPVEEPAMRATLLLQLVFCAACLSACSIKISRRVIETPVREGMTSGQLISEFGAPRRVERYADGSQDWFYRFASGESWTGPAPGWNHPDDLDQGDEVTSSLTFEESAIHLSPSLRVTGEIPPGKVIGKKPG